MKLSYRDIRRRNSESRNLSTGLSLFVCVVCDIGFARRVNCFNFYGLCGNVINLNEDIYEGKNRISGLFIISIHKVPTNVQIKAQIV